MKKTVVGLVSALGLAGCLASARASDDQTTFVEPDTGAQLVDGDVLKDDAEQLTTSQGLTVALVDGRDDVWGKTQRKALSYCVDARSFGPASDEVVRALERATADWEAWANVRFVHALEQDGHCTRSNTQVVFNVRAVQGRPYLARSFFPSSSRATRELLVDATALPPPAPLTLAGVLRHELGHVLGLRHEHTRRAGNPCFEDANWRAVTAYDVRSVMHYPQCDGVPGHDLVLTALDERGIAALYP